MRFGRGIGVGVVNGVRRFVRTTPNSSNGFNSESPEPGFADAFADEFALVVHSTQPFERLAQRLALGAEG